MENITVKVNRRTVKKVDDQQCDPINFISFNNVLFPLEILIKIFEYLPAVDRIRIERVCKMWYHASRDSWSKIKVLQFLTPVMNPGLFQKFRKYHVVNSDKLIVLGTHDSKIISGVLSHCGRYIVDFNFDYIIEKIPVRLPGGRYIEFTPDNSYNQLLSTIGLHCKNIRYLRVVQQDCDIKELSELLSKNRMLESVKLFFKTDRVGSLSTKHLKILSVRSQMNDSKNLMGVVRRAETLEELNINMNNYLFKILKYKQSLKALRLFYNGYICRTGHLFSIAKLANLEILTIYRFFKLGDVAALRAISRNCRKLSKLLFTGGQITKEQFDVITNFPALESLELRNIIGITDDIVSHMVRVKQLIIRDCAFSMVSENSYILLIKNSNIERLDVSGAKITPKFFEKIVTVVSERDKVVEIVVTGSMCDTATELCELCPFIKITSKH